MLYKIIVDKTVKKSLEKMVKSNRIEEMELADSIYFTLDTLEQKGFDNPELDI